VASATVQITASAARGKLNLPVGELVEVRTVDQNHGPLELVISDNAF
jgi:hypothetical protein